MFTQFPEEILLAIFDNLYLFDLLQCQKVCHAWYSSAHITLLRSVHLSTDSAIQKFNNSIDYNPKQNYLNAVRNIVIGVTDCELVGYQYNLENIHKIFLRFPNLQKIYITAPLQSFNDFEEDFCDLFLKSCPKLTVFEVLLEDESARFSECLYKFRCLLTKLDIDDISGQTRFDSIEEFIAQFPRLKSLESEYEALSLKRLLPVFQHLPLTSIRMEVSFVNEEDFAETYLNSKTIDEQNQLINNFANITDVHLNFCNTLCSNSIRFISRYLTLKSFRMFRYRFTRWPNSELQLLHNDIIKLAISAKELGSVYVDLERSALRGCFSYVATKIYRRTSNATKRCLTLEVCDLITDRSSSVNLHVICNQQSSKHSISLRCSSDILDCLGVLVDLTPIMNVDEFKLSISAPGRRQTEHCTFAMIMEKLEDVFTGIPSLKKADLDIPPFYTEETTIHYVYDQVYRGLTHLQLKELTISAAPDMKIQTMLNRYAFTFPDLECLTLYYYSGIWTPENGEFRVILSRYSLKTLTIDMTPIKRNTFKYLATQFFVMELETLGNNKRQLSKVSLDLSSITPITDTDLQGLVRGKDYFKAYVGIRSLERLDICMNHNISDEYYSAGNLKPVTCINMI